MCDDNTPQESEEIELEEELDEEAFDVIRRLYDNTFRDLANR